MGIADVWGSEIASHFMISPTCEALPETATLSAIRIPKWSLTRFDLVTMLLNFR